MSYFIINHTRKYIYKLENWHDTFEDVMDKNPTWQMSDNVDFQDDDVEQIELHLKQSYSTNITVYDVAYYTTDSKVLIYYMKCQGFNDYDISRAINIWQGLPEFQVAQYSIDELVAWTKGQQNSGDASEMMLCDMMKRIM